MIKLKELIKENVQLPNGVEIQMGKIFTGGGRAFTKEQDVINEAISRSYYLEKYGANDEFSGKKVATYSKFDKNKIKSDFNRFAKTLKDEEELHFMGVNTDKKRSGDDYLFSVVNQDGKNRIEITKGSRTFYKPFKSFKLESVNERISVSDERYFGKKGIIIMIDVNGKKVSAIFKDKKNANKFNRNKPADIKKLLQLAKKTKYPKAIDESVNEGKKRYYQQDRVGSAKYTISYHDGKKKHKDGSDFFDIKIFRNKKDLAKFVNTLSKSGYVYGFNESVNESVKFDSIQPKDTIDYGYAQYYVAKNDGKNIHMGLVAKKKATGGMFTSDAKLSKSNFDSQIRVKFIKRVLRNGKPLKESVNEKISKEEWSEYPKYARKLKPYMRRLLKIPVKVRVIKQANHNPWIDVRVARSGKDVIPNDFRKRALKVIGGGRARDMDNINYGNIRTGSVSLKYDEWVKLLGNKVK